MDFTFNKEERLCSRKAFENLIKEGSSQFNYPFKVLWVRTDYPISKNAQVAFAVSKKRFKRANKRNLVKRRLREAYRLNKDSFYLSLNENQIHLQILIIYVAPTVMTYHEIEPKIKNALDNILVAIQKPGK